MKNIFYKLVLLFSISILFVSCENTGDISLKGKTYEYHNGEFGTYKIRNTYEFLPLGKVYHSMQVGYSSEYNTDGCDLYYKVNGNSITIYYGTIGWKESVRNTVYAYGYYYGDYIIIDGNQYNLRNY